ncbi:hypothetical protein FA95DRAFT_591976 [Auriscalpium vulgare]|uniref:Uncharacterized protein n=1 Tax=Auriscalpium vulgare TaxID=40419 RepID=A0ACB8RDV3_9AGAM|nr:hypothetical protein FA95DRAFT_591976 [Auriscalpium vulgare]
MPRNHSQHSRPSSPRTSNCSLLPTSPPLTVIAHLLDFVGEMNGYPQVNYPHGGFGDAAQSNTMNPGYPYPFYDYGHYQPQALPHNFTTATYPTAPYSYIPQPPAQGDYWSEASQPAHFAAADVAPSYGQTPAPYQSQSWGNAPASTFGQGGASAATFASPAPQWQPLGLPPHAHANGYAQADTYQAQSGHWSQATAHMPTVASVQGLSMNMGVFSYEDVSPLLHAPPSLPPASQTGADVEPSVSSKPVSAKSGSGLGPVRRRKTTKRASPIVSKPITTKKSGKTMKAEFEMMPTWAKPQLEQHKCAKCSDGNIEPNNIPAHLFSKTHVQDLPRSLQDVIPFYVCRAFPRCTQMYVLFLS